MTSTVISIENVSKSYRLGSIGTGTFYGDVKRWWARQRGKPDPYLKIGETDHGNRDGEILWALKDINFRIQQGEALGIIGRNGAGKSTLLKVLSRVATPTSGTVKVKGRIASLLEVGTGFHPELTGRENIYLNGAIMGMGTAEVKRKFAEIVDFSGVEKFIDTPVKRYSSGMYVRLAFAVAAHLEPEILVVDEVLAVGDAGFQKKCLGKMSDVTHEGRTVLFVSHNMGAVARLCSTGIVLDQGGLIYSGDITQAIEFYTENGIVSSAELFFEPDYAKKMQFTCIKLLNGRGVPATDLDKDSTFQIYAEFEVRERISNSHIAIMLEKADGTPIIHASNRDDNSDRSAFNTNIREPGKHKMTVEFPGKIFNAGVFQIRMGLAQQAGDVFDYKEPFTFQLHDHGSFASLGVEGKQRPGLLSFPLKWMIE